MAGGEDSWNMGPTWRLKDRSVSPKFPLVMGILNATPDSFHAASRVQLDQAVGRAEHMLAEGADILDLGGASSRPGAHEISEQEELDRVIPVVEAIHTKRAEAWLSIDTWRARVAAEAVRAGARMVNDISAGTLDPDMFTTVAACAVPYVVMHMQGTPRTMQTAPAYQDVIAEVLRFLSERMEAAHRTGIADVIIDPGFGFGKTTAHNYKLLRGLPRFAALGAPVLVGLSRKRMITEVLDTTAAEALNGTTILNTVAVLNGASILRVHDVREARQVIELLARLPTS